MSSANVTILIPTFQRPTLLARAINSALRQSYCNIKVFVYDNASGDETASVVNSFINHDSRLTYVRNPINIGAAENFRKAISEVKTAYFTIFSDDDVLLPQCIERAVTGLRDQPKMMAWAGIVLSATEAGHVTSCKPEGDWTAGANDARIATLRVSSNSRPETTGMLFRSLLVPDLLAAPVDFYGADVHWVMVAAKMGGIGFTPAPSAIFLRHPGSISYTSTATAGRFTRDFAMHTTTADTLMRLFVRNNPLAPGLQVACLRRIRQWYGRDILFRLGMQAFAAGEDHITLQTAYVLRQRLHYRRDANNLVSLVNHASCGKKAHRCIAGAIATLHLWRFRLFRIKAKIQQYMWIRQYKHTVSAALETLPITDTSSRPSDTDSLP